MCLICRLARLLVWHIKTVFLLRKYKYTEKMTNYSHFSMQMLLLPPLDALNVENFCNIKDIKNIKEERSQQRLGRPNQGKKETYKEFIERFS